jgi:hypothetical protein
LTLCLRWRSITLEREWDQCQASVQAPERSLRNLSDGSGRSRNRGNLRSLLGGGGGGIFKNRVQLARDVRRPCENTDALTQFAKRFEAVECAERAASAPAQIRQRIETLKSP